MSTYATQTNTQEGDIVLPSTEDLSGKEGRLVKIVSDSGTAEVALPDAITDYTPFVLIDGADASGDNVTIRPLSGQRNVRALLDGTCVPGDVIVLDAVDGTDDGKVRKLPAAGGTYRGLGIALETGADEQLVKFQPVELGNIVAS